MNSRDVRLKSEPEIGYSDKLLLVCSVLSGIFLESNNYATILTFQFFLIHKSSFHRKCIFCDTDVDKYPNH
jgi:hypothetical protein